jgi:hypothetical protein
MPARQITLWRRLHPFLSESLRYLASLVFVARVEPHRVGPSSNWAPDTPSLPSASSRRTKPLPHATLRVSPSRDGKLVAVGPVTLPPAHRQFWSGPVDPNHAKKSTPVVGRPRFTGERCFPIWAGRRGRRRVGIGGARTAPPSIKVFGATPRIVAYFFSKTSAISSDRPSWVSPKPLKILHFLES